MRKTCRVPFCANKDTMKKDNPNLRFHEFPSNWTLREKWVKVIRRKDFVPRDKDYVCSIHFHENDYRTGLKVVRLRADAVPSIFPGFPKYLQPKKKKERRRIKRATPEVIASFKRSRKVKESEEIAAFSQPLNIIDASTLPNENILFDSGFANGVDDAVEYEVIPIDESLGNILQSSKCDLNQPAKRDASTQASGMWEKIQELYKIIRKLRTDLLKKTNEISSLSSQNKKLKSQLSELKLEAKQTVPSASLKPRIPKKSRVPKIKSTNKVVERKEDLSTYFHPRVPRSLCPPKHTSFPKKSQEMVLLENILNQAVGTQNKKTSDINHATLESKIPIRPVYSEPNGVSLAPSPGIRNSSVEASNTCVSTDCIKSPIVVCVQQNGYETVNKSVGENGFHEEHNLHHLQNYVQTVSEELVLVPETCLIESECNEIIIYSSGNDVGFVERETENAIQGIIN